MAICGKGRQFTRFDYTCPNGENLDSLRALFLSYDGMTDPLGQSQVIPYLAGLTAKGVRFSLISAEKPEAFSSGKSIIESLMDRHRIDWHPIEYHASPPILSTMRDRKEMLRLATALHKHDPFQVVHCRSYIACMVGLALQRQFGVKVIFDMRGFWADERVDGGLWKLNNPLYRTVYKYFKRKERQFLEKADAIISLTQTGKDEMLTWSIPHLQPDKITVIPCCADLNHFNYQTVEQSRVQALRNELGIETDQLVISYLGSIGTWYMLDEMLDFFKVVSERHENAKFLFITGESESSIIDQASHRGLSPNQLIVRKSPRAEVPTYLSLSSVSLFFIIPSFSKKASSPTKLAETLGLGIPIIANTGVGDVEHVLNDDSFAATTSTFQQEDYVRLAEQIPQLLQADRSHIRNTSLAHFDLNTGVDRYWSVYQSLSE